MAPLVSICVPMYNGAAHLAECLESALAQTFHDTEIVLVDDASTDNTLEIAEAFVRRDSRVRLYRNPKNLGLVANWGKCVNLANGEWIKFLFQDDLLEPICVERMMNATHGRVSLVVCRRALLFRREESENRKIYWETFITKNCLPQHFPGCSFIGPDQFAMHMAQSPLTNCIGEPTATLLHRSVFTDFGSFNSHLIQLVDWEYCARIAVQKGLSYIDDKLATFRVHNLSATAFNKVHRKYHANVLDPLIILHELAYSPFYATVRAAADRHKPPINLLHRLVATARDARSLAHDQTGNSIAPDDHALAEWRHVVRYYPRVTSLPASYIIAGGIRRAKTEMERMLRMAGSFFHQE
jgi:glycosyltransferase involved in cell wall biosynthesis